MHSLFAVLHRLVRWDTECFNTSILEPHLLEVGTCDLGVYPMAVYQPSHRLCTWVTRRCFDCISCSNMDFALKSISGIFFLVLAFTFPSGQTNPSCGYPNASYFLQSELWLITHFAQVSARRIWDPSKWSPLTSNPTSWRYLKSVMHAFAAAALPPLRSKIYFPVL